MITLSILIVNVLEFKEQSILRDVLDTRIIKSNCISIPTYHAFTFFPISLFFVYYSLLLLEKWEQHLCINAILKEEAVHRLLVVE